MVEIIFTVTTEHEQCNNYGAGEGVGCRDSLPLGRNWGRC